MARANAMAPTEAIRIEDEVWEEAFTRREPARPARERERRLRPVDREYADWLLEATGESSAEATSWTLPSRAATSVPASVQTVAEPEEPMLTLAVTDEQNLAGGIVVRPELEFGEVAMADPAVSPTDPAVSPTALSATPATLTAAPVPARRTVKIQGRGAERHMPWPDTSRRRQPRRPYEQTGFRADRIAMWAVFLGFALVLIAILSAAH